MGEAKNRKKNEPYFGRKPKNGRGIMLSAAVSVDGNKVVCKGDIDPLELRRAVLFWDRLVWPDSKIISVQSGEDVKILEREGLLQRPRPTRYPDRLGIRQTGGLIGIEGGGTVNLSGDYGKHFIDEHIEEYQDLDAREPGQWVLSQGEGSFYLKQDLFPKGRGQLITLSRAIPLPGPDFPIPDLLEFKQKRSDELVALTYELDRFYSQVQKSRDPDFELNRLITVIDRQCADLIKAAKESKRKFHVGDMNISLSLDSIESGVNRAVAWEAAIGTITGLPIVGTLLGAAASSVSFGRGIGARKLSDRRSPFSVVSDIHKDLVT